MALNVKDAMLQWDRTDLDLFDPVNPECTPQNK